MSFYDLVYKNVKNIPIGKVTTYGQIAFLCESPNAARVVGTALHANPEPGVIPCHRVVNRLGYLAGGGLLSVELKSKKACLKTRVCMYLMILLLI